MAANPKMDLYAYGPFPPHRFMKFDNEKWVLYQAENVNGILVETKVEP